MRPPIFPPRHPKGQSATTQSDAPIRGPPLPPAHKVGVNVTTTRPPPMSRAQPFTSTSSAPAKRPKALAIDGNLKPLFVDEINIPRADAATRAKYAAERPLRDMMDLWSSINNQSKQEHSSALADRHAKSPKPRLIVVVLQERSVMSKKPPHSIHQTFSARYCTPRAFSTSSRSNGTKRSDSV